MHLIKWIKFWKRMLVEWVVINMKTKPSTHSIPSFRSGSVLNVSNAKEEKKAYQSAN